MKEYFLLQYKLTNRRFKDSGMLPWMGYALLSIVTLIISNIIFSSILYPHFFYALLVLLGTLKLSNKLRNDFLKQVFKNYKQLRVLENLLVSFPFVAFLIFKQCFLTVILLEIAIVILAFVKVSSLKGVKIAAPFSNRLYEFQTGFRKLFYIYPILYYLVYIATTVKNPNLGIAALIGVFMLSMSYYSKPENDYFVWNYSLTPKEFLVFKIKTSILYTTLLSIPMFLIFGILFFNQIELFFVFYVLGCIYLSTFILMKYSGVFSDEISIPQIFIYFLGVAFPPWMLFVVPFFYLKSIKNLNTILK